MSSLFQSAHCLVHTSTLIERPVRPSDFCGAVLGSVSVRPDLMLTLGVRQNPRLLGRGSGIRRAPVMLDDGWEQGG